VVVPNPSAPGKTGRAEEVASAVVTLGVDLSLSTSVGTDTVDRSVASSLVVSMAGSADGLISE
jgi:hypothetical protein